MIRRHAREDALARIEGTVSDVSVRRLLDICRERRITGVLRVVSWGRAGSIQVRAGHVEQAMFGGARGDDALAELLALRDGLFALQQRLPDLAQAASPAPGRTSLSALLRQCREHALSCTITAIRDRERAEICCRAGQIAYTQINGVRHPGATGELQRFEHACVRIEPLPLSLDGRIPVDRAATELVAAHPPRPRPQRKPLPAPPAARALPAPPAARGTPPARPRSGPGTTRPAAVQPARVPRAPQVARPAARPARPATSKLVWSGSAAPTEIVTSTRGYVLPYTRDRMVAAILALGFLMVLAATLVASRL